MVKLITISYTYDVAGNRVSKTYGNTVTVYVRDASGNVMGVYKKVGVLELCVKTPNNQVGVSTAGEIRQYLGESNSITYSKQSKSCYIK